MAMLGLRGSVRTVLAFSLAFWILSLPPIPGEAMAEVSVANRDFEAKGRHTISIGDMPHVLVRGEIDARDVSTFAAAVEELRNIGFMMSPDGRRQPIVILDSPGGDVQAAMAMGRIARKHLGLTYVERRCDSACVLVYAAGVNRMLARGARLGIHRPRFEDYASFASLSGTDAMGAYDRMSREVAKYLDEMRITAQLGTMMMSVPSENVEYLDVDLAERLGLTGKDPAYEEWETAVGQNDYGPEAYQALNAYTACSAQCQDNGCRKNCWAKSRMSDFYDSRTRTWKRP